MCTVLIAITSMPPFPAFAQTSSGAAPNTVRKGTTRVTLFEPLVNISDDPVDGELSTARFFREPLTPLLSKAPLLNENRSLAQALRAHRQKGNNADVSDLKEFIVAHPNSRWRPALEVNIAHSQFEKGQFSEALALYKSAWDATKDDPGENQKTLANEALSELLLLLARLGRKQDLEKLLKDANQRVLRGSIEAKVRSAEESLAAMNHRPDCAFKCGPFALNHIIRLSKIQVNQSMPRMDSTEHGTNMAQLQTWAKECGLDYQIARRSPGAPLVVPAIIHWKSDHFAALTGRHAEQFHVEDSTFGNNGNFWLSAGDIDGESDGFFLVPSGQLPVGWQSVSANDGQHIWGKGVGHTRSGPDVPQCPNNECGCDGMPRASAYGMLSTLNIKDKPLGYSPPIGPSILFQLNYSHLEVNQPASPAFTTFGPDWSFNWVCYLTVDASQNVTLRRSDGQSELYNFMEPDNLTNPYPVNVFSQANLTKTATGTYLRSLPDGSVQIFDQSDGTGRVFMTKMVDSQGNTAAITYDSNFRVTTITDAIGQASTITYLSNTVGNVGFYKVTQLSDPFSRIATFAFDSSTTHITSITDAVGLQSSFVYDPASSFIMSMTTPYGTTSFQTYVPAQGSHSGNQLEARGLRTVFPDGTQSALENWAGQPLQTYFWDRHAMELYPGDQGGGILTHCKTTTFLVSPDGVFETSVPKSVKMPLESQVTYSYEGEGVVPGFSVHSIGVSNKPIEIRRTLDIGGDQVSTFEYDDFGHVTRSVDPVGRTFSFNYSANGVDLLEAREIKGGNNFLQGKWQYNDKHLPLVYFDGSGRKTQYSYIPTTGQIETITDANGKVTTYGYNVSHYLTSIDGPLTGDKDKSLLAYDTVGRVSGTTDSEGYVLQYFYDNLDRLVKISYPDATVEEFKFEKLDQVAQIDRLGRLTQSTYNSMDELVKTVDPLGRSTEYSWCSCGSLVSLKDGAGNQTSWHHDLQGRTTSKIYADESEVDYEFETSTSRLKSRTDALNQKTNYVYNLDDTLASVTYDNEIHATSDVTLTWDANYRRIQTLENGWGKLEYLYNPYIIDPFGTPTTGGGMLQRIKHYINPGLAYDSTRDITYVYDSLGRTTNRSINASANSITWAYDEMSRVTSETNTLGQFTFNYVDQSAPGGDRGTTRLSKITYPNSQITKFNYFGNLNDQRLRQIANLNSVGGQLSQFNYEYNPAGEITKWQQQQNGNNLVYALGYDRAGQLSSAQAGSGLPIAPFAKESHYGYDPAANRIAERTSNVENVRIGGSKTTGDTLTITVKDAALVSGQKAVSYVVQSADTLPTIAAGLAAAISSDEGMQSVGIEACSNINAVSIRSVSSNITTYSVSTSGGATETLSFGPRGDGTVNATIGGTKTTGNVLTIRVKDSGLAGGQRDVSYTVLAGDTLTTMATGLKTAINADATLQALGVTATSVSTVINLRSKSPNLTRFDQFVSGGATATITLTQNVNPTQLATVDGTKTTGDVVTLTVFNSSLPSGVQAISYTALAGDTLTTIAAGLSSAINANGNLNTNNIKATSAGTVVSINSASPNLTSYSIGVNDGGTEVVALSVNPNPIQIVSVGGSKTTSDVLTISVFDASLAGGAQSVSYTVLAGDTLDTIATGIKSAINANSNLQAAGISAVASGARISIESNSRFLTFYRKSANATATESLLLVPKHVDTETAAISGVPTTGDTLTITFYDSGLPSGQVSKSYVIPSGSPTLTTIAAGIASAINSDTDLKTVGVTADSVSNVVNISSASVDTTTYSQSTSFGATSLIFLGSNLGLLKATHNNLNELTTLSPGGSTAFRGIATKPLEEAGSNSPVPSANSNISTQVIALSIAPEASTTYTPSVSGGATETLTLGAYSQGSTIISIGGTKTTGDILTVTVNDTRLVGGQKAINYTVLSGDNLVSIAKGLASALANDSSLKGIGLSTKSDALLTLDWSQSFNGSPELSAGKNIAEVKGLGAISGTKTNSYRLAVVGTNYSTALSSGATVALRLGDNDNGNTTLIVGGTVTTGNVATIVTNNPTLTAGPVSISYTAIGGDTTTSIASALKNGINADATLQSLGISATSSASVITIKASKTGQRTLVYDANGNMTGDGVNTYEWDAENRLTKISYPGSGNNSQFTFDGIGRNIKILEQSGGSTTSTKQFIWCANERCEERDGSGILTKQFFSGGQRNSATNYLYAMDHLNSIREVTDSSATIQAQYAFDPYGRVIMLQGSQTADFRFAGYYQHASSALNLTLNRPLSSNLGRWICRDPIEEKNGTNLFAYCGENPIDHRDPLGLDFGGALLGAAAGAALGGLSGGILGGGAGTLAAPGVGTVGLGGFTGGQGAAAGAAIGAAWGINNIQTGYGWGDAASSLSTLLSGGNSGAGSSSGSGTGTINCRPDPCEPPPHAFKNKEACYDYCKRNCAPPSRLGKCALTCFTHFPYAGPPSGSGGALPPFPHIFKP